MKCFIEEHFRKIITVSVVVFCTFATNTFAQLKVTEEQRGKMRAKYAAYQERLNLSKEQSEKVEAINMAYFEELTELRDSNRPKLTKYKKFRSIQTKKDRQMKEVLDNNQYKMYKEFQVEMREEFREVRKNN